MYDSRNQECVKLFKLYIISCYFNINPEIGIRFSVQRYEPGYYDCIYVSNRYQLDLVCNSLFLRKPLILEI